MRIRVLRADTMQQAMARLVAELGPDAALLSSRNTRDGVEVTAAVTKKDRFSLTLGHGRTSNF